MGEIKIFLGGGFDVGKGGRRFDEGTNQIDLTASLNNLLGNPLVALVMFLRWDVEGFDGRTVAGDGGNGGQLEVAKHGKADGTRDRGGGHGDRVGRGW